jgi:hypothetical protein
MFGQGATPGKVDMWCYHEDEEDFTKGHSRVDNMDMCLLTKAYNRCHPSRYLGLGTSALFAA